MNPGPAGPARPAGADPVATPPAGPSRPVGAAHLPFSAVVGQDDAKTALLLAAIDPKLGGVLLRGDKGSAKTTLARGLAALLAEDAPFVELPLGATEDRVVGSIDVGALLGGRTHAFRPGLLADADGGVLYVDEINLLADHLVDTLLDVATSGVNRVERDGISETHPARFVLVGSMNPEEGELRPQLLDRFGLTVEVRATTDPAERAEIVRRQLRFDEDLGPGDAAVRADAGLRDALGRSAPAGLHPDVPEAASRLALAVGAEGLRADLSLCRAVAALAGWEGRTEATPDDLRRVAGLVLAHRRRRSPFEAPGLGDRELDRALDEALGAAGGGGATHGGRPDGDGGPDGDGSSAGHGSSAGGGASGRTGADGTPGSAGPGAGGSETAGTGTDADPADGADTDGRDRDGRGRDGGAEAGGGGPAGGSAGAGRGDAAGPSGDGGRAHATGSSQADEDRHGPDTVPDLRAPEPPGRSTTRARTETAGRGGRARSAEGRTVTTAPYEGSGPGSRLAVPATALAYATRTAGRSGAPTTEHLTTEHLTTEHLTTEHLATEDLRAVVAEQTRATLVILAVDASGSMAARDRLATARAAVLGLLGDAYRRRDRVALIVFRGTTAEVVLRPTGSVEIARARLGDIPTGGTTPLAAGLRAVADLARATLRSGGPDPVAVLITDGRATAGGDDPLAAAEAAAADLAATGTPCLVLDAESGPTRLGLARSLAVTLGADHVELAALDQDRDGAVEAAIRRRVDGPGPRS